MSNQEQLFTEITPNSEANLSGGGCYGYGKGGYDKGYNKGYNKGYHKGYDDCYEPCYDPCYDPCKKGYKHY